MEVSLDKGDRPAGLAEAEIKTVGRGMDEPDSFFAAGEGFDPGDVFSRRPAAVVAQAPEDGDVAAELQSPLRARREPLLDVVVFGVIEADGDSIGENLGAVHSPPAI